MAKNKRKPPAAAVKRTQSLHAPVPSHTNQDGSPVPSCISAPGHGTTSPQEVDGSPVANSKPDGSLVDNPMASGSPVDNTNGSLVDNTNGSLEKVLEEGCYEDEDLGEEHLDFSCSEEDYPPSSPVTVVPDLVAGSVEKSHCVAPLNPRGTQSTPVVPAPPACPKGATFTPSGSAPVDTTAAPSPVSGKWRDLFSSNRNTSSCPKLMHFSALHDNESCPLLTEDLDHSCDDWKLCAIGYVSGKFPGYKALKSIIANVWKCEATLTMHESGWLIYKFLNEEDKFSVLCGGPYLVYGRPLILRPMSDYFDFSSSEMTQVPVWIKFPNLPLKCWTPRCLSKLASILGKPIQCDKLTATKERASYARVLVEVDLLSELRSSINVTLPNGNPHIQRVIYETLPKYCKLCKVLGHSTGACAKGKAEVRSVKKVDAASVTSEGNVNDKGSVFTRLTPVADSLGDDPPAVAPPVESTPIVTPPVDGPELDAPSNPSVSPVAPDGQPRPQATPASVEEWQPVRNRRNNAGNKRRTQTPSPVNGNPTPQTMFPPRGKLLPYQLILLQTRPPFVQLQV
ncbi:DUF4283 domain-containing protein [Salix suchowensis]|nr:DUF4283 domain-containing protein [Salix suchowensis]